MTHRTLALSALLSWCCMNAQNGGRETHAFRVGEASRSDSIDILHTAIDLDLTDADIGLIHAHTTLTFVPKVTNITALPLDLMALTVDSVTLAGSQLLFSQFGETLTVHLGSSFGPADTLQLTVHYGGDPATDGGGSGFGGFYTGSNYQYAIGVGLDDQPHSYGRSWFPCFDNFVERCTFDLTVLTEANRTVMAIGLLDSTVDLGGGLHSYHWTLHQAIPSYLATVNAAGYRFLTDTFTSVAGNDVPVLLGALPGDTADMHASFAHLHDIFDHFEQRFGPYRWDKVGYVLTPVGAMESATCINFPVSTVDGSFADEPRISHELAHHWFGDLITCQRPEEMYINEGFAEYCSFLFVEHRLGSAAYLKKVRDNHRDMIQHAHLQDQGWWPLSDIPQDWTYGTTAYNKGADVLHSLRSYLGDPLFDQGFTTIMADAAFTDVNTLQLRDALTAATGVNLTDYFADWIMQPGWSAFEVDSFSVSGTAPNYTVAIHIEQKQRGPADPYHAVPVTLNAVDGSGNTQLDTVLVGDQFTTVNITTPFVPIRIGLNEDERISLAITQDIDTITATSIFTYPHADLRLDVNVLPAPARLVMQEYWVAADPSAIDAFAYVVSPDRWWRVAGDLAPGTQIDGRIVFDGRPTIGSSIDLGLVQDLAGLAFNEDSVVLLYRPDPSSAWNEFPAFTVNTQGSSADGFGRVDFTGFALGDYTLGWRKSPVGLKPVMVASGEWVAGPNPASDRIKVEWKGDGPPLRGRIELLDSAGKLLLTRDVRDQRRMVIDLGGLGTGQMLLRFVDEQGALWPVQKVAVLK